MRGQKIRHLAIRLRKFGQLCPIAGYKEDAIKLGSKVIVETDRGLEAGQIVAFERGYPKNLSREVRLRKVIRYASPEDLKHIEGLDEKERKSIRVAMKKVREHEIPIKVINVEYLFDDKKVHIFYRVTENKNGINTKDLKKDLSEALDAKVEIHLVSPRDEAKIIGGLGQCGRSLCCVSWLDKPRHVSVKALKEKGIPISPTKTSGICGRLMCCLQYESETGK
jgi:cell fate regulator YaaT (PSP1 superfamily)